MTVSCDRAPRLGFFERWLSLWVAIAIGLGLLLGQRFPAFFAGLSRWEIAQINLPIAVLIWCMILPMLVDVDLGAAKQLGRQPKGFIVTLAVNWAIKPFTMALLGWLFLGWIFRDWLDPQLAESAIAGLILLGAAPCTAMVFVWSRLTQGDPTFTLIQVAVNDLVTVVAYAPITALLLGLAAITVPWPTLLGSVLLYVAVPLLVAQSLRSRLLKRGSAALRQFDRACKPFSTLGLLLTVLLLFGFQASTFLAQPQTIALIAVPILLQSLLIFAIAYGWAWRWKLPHGQAAPAALIGTSNFFELAVAVAISLFGLQSGAAIATVVGVLVEVPMMLVLVAIANRSRSWFGSSETAA
ncbi:ACR3 family arsenite efflux transporter [Synechococcus elongatus]|uniref:Multidrug-efflux transporter n=1 Tax=Synechococcus elongatus (strain ATCC 33912 / PCC 7942 / FACHB-805) TaxID=1140 RepID=Q31LV1_SYNE7|nr:ACR3 family arsenite efflux transporter [Synechococcus elongatus]ABB57968.1 multidrug-efflux transporter [Synechococcus elongatus PCC 7942 = FACHB-805]MBD2586686.1 ACR3 family arsenite efflux transporter [Synechococcus elongatus FACHB-242]MBD2687760.1 ACR3 family arsenite efflux transporter [Synechococcus elongatus FACHB-1061]MBD2706530.1 ACR3 family arsenite efflux transporter [Synechococcus elongatus PCC 7942 = FACHB-805]UOW71761.1 arsenite transporter, ACR3 family [Synechococcus elongatu